MIARLTLQVARQRIISVETTSYLPSGTAQQIDERLTSLAVSRAGQDYEEGRWLLAAFVGSTT